MPLVVDSVPLSYTQNSYVDLAWMEDYVTTRVVDQQVAIDWDNLDQSVQASILVNASRSIDNMCTWIGEQYSRDQRLKWPRVEAWIENFMLDVTTTPQAVMEATAEMAIWVMQNNGSVSVQNSEALQSVKVGPINVRFNDQSGQSAYSYMPENIAWILKDYAQVNNPSTPGAKQMKMATLVRR